MLVSATSRLVPFAPLACRSFSAMSSSSGPKPTAAMLGIGGDGSYVRSAQCVNIKFLPRNGDRRRCCADRLWRKRTTVADQSGNRPFPLVHTTMAF